MTAQKQSTVIAARIELIDEFERIYDSTATDMELPAIVDWLFSQDAIADSYFEGVTGE